MGQAFPCQTLAQSAPRVQKPIPNNDPNKGHVWRDVEIVVPIGVNETYQATGVIPSREGEDKGTLGTLINACLIVAPRHAVSNTDLHEGAVDVLHRTATFMYGYTGDPKRPYFKGRVSIEAIICGKTSSDHSYAPAEDYCVFRAERNLTDEIPRMPIAQLGLEDAKKEVNQAIGFTAQSVAQMNGQWAIGKDTHAFITDGIESLYAMNAVATSGTPLVAASNGKLSMVAMVVTYQFSVPMKTIVDAINSTPIEKRTCTR